MGCGEFLVKYILFFANLFFALAGLALLGVGVAVELRISAITDVLDGQSVQIAPISAMVVGGLVFIIAFFGCCGAIRESNCMLVTFSIFMLILMVVKIAFATLIFVGLDGVVNDIPTWLTQAFEKDRTAFQVIESTFHCCGPNGALSYVSPTLPDTCCAKPPCVPMINAYHGCSEIIQEFFRTFGLVIGIVAIVIVAIELVAAVFGLCLANHVRHKYRRARY